MLAGRELLKTTLVSRGSLAQAKGIYSYLSTAICAFMKPDVGVDSKCLALRYQADQLSSFASFAEDLSRLIVHLVVSDVRSVLAVFEQR